MSGVLAIMATFGCGFCISYLGMLVTLFLDYTEKIESKLALKLTKRSKNFCILCGCVFLIALCFSLR